MQVILALLVVSLVSVNCFIAVPPMTTVLNATTYTVSFNVSASSDIQDRIAYFQRIFVPTTASIISISGNPVLFGGVTCSNPAIQIGVRGIPCAIASIDFPVIGTSPCDDYFFQTENNLYQAGVDAENDIEDWQLGTYWFLMIRKDDSTDDFETVCQYQITTTISECPTGQVAISEDDPTCLPVNTISPNGTYFVIPPTLTGGPLVYAVNFATDQNVVHVVVNTTDFTTLAGQSGFALDFADNNACWSEESGNQILMTCNSVPAGPFYIVLESDSSSTGTALISVTSTVCGATFSGFNCASPLFNFSSAPTFTGNVAPSTGTFLNQAVFFIDFAVNSSVSLNITVTNNAGDGVLVVRKGSFPYDDDIASGTGGPGEIFQESTDLPSALFFEPVDSYVGGRYYFSVVNTDTGTTTLSYTVTSDGFSTTSPTIGTASAATASATTTAAATSATATTTATVTSATSTGTHPSTSTGATVTSTGATVTGATGTTTTTTAATTVSTAATATTTAKATTGSANALVVPIFLLASLILALL